jgi:hypothetical protein
MMYVFVHVVYSLRQLHFWPKIWQCQKWSIYVWKHVARNCKCYHQIVVYMYPFYKQASFFVEELLAPRWTPQLEDHPLLAVCDCLFNIFVATLHIIVCSSICTLRMCHAMVTGTHLSWHTIHICHKNESFKNVNHAVDDYFWHAISKVFLCVMLFRRVNSRMHSNAINWLNLLLQLEGDLGDSKSAVTVAAHI